MRANFLTPFMGPRNPADVPDNQVWRYRLPGLLLGGAGFLLLISMFTPYWQMTLNAPQYPGGLQVKAYVNRMTGDVAEIDGLNHYIGMRPLEEAAQIERRFSIVAISSIALLAAAAIFVHTKWAALLALPAASVPYVFLADLYLWLRHFGLNLDPTAALSSSIEPFVPPVLGTGTIAQFTTVALPDWGLYLSFLASLMVIGGLIFHRRAYKPLVDQSGGS